MKFHRTWEKEFLCKSPKPSEEKVAATEPADEAAADTISEDPEEAVVEKPTLEKPTPEEDSAEVEVEVEAEPMEFGLAHLIASWKKLNGK